MRRGCVLSFTHFHSFPFTTMQSQEKVRQIVSVMNRYQRRSRVYWVGFAEVQKKIMAFTPPAARVLFYRRAMMAIAERLAVREQAQALVRGRRADRMSGERGASWRDQDG